MMGRTFFSRAVLRGVLTLVPAVLITLGAIPALRPETKNSSASPVGVDRFVEQLQDSYRQTHTLRSDFTQTYNSLGRARTESGVVYFARGGKMRWDYRQPEQKLFLSDGEQLLLYLPSENQMTRSRVKASDDARVPFRLLLSHLDLHKVFGEIKFDDKGLRPQNSDRVLIGLPKRNAEDDFREVLMEITPTFDIRQILVRYPDQSSMGFTFDHTLRDVPLNAALFSFTPPAGTEVIDNKE